MSLGCDTWGYYEKPWIPNQNTLISYIKYAESIKIMTGITLMQCFLVFLKRRHLAHPCRANLSIRAEKTTRSHLESASRHNRGRALNDDTLDSSSSNNIPFVSSILVE